MSEPLYSVVLFPSISGAMKAEKLLQREGFTLKLIPVPRQLSSDCGICLRFQRPDERRIASLLKENKVEIEGLHEIWPPIAEALAPGGSRWVFLEQAKEASGVDSEKKIRLTETVHGSGWACKIGPGDLDKALCGLPLLSDPNLIRGLETADDAGVYKLSEETALIQTVDFFTPIVDDPYTFGQVAVANALSDVYAMGGKPLTAMNIVCFPINTMDLSVLREILAGGLEKMREAQVVLVGGHSVEDPELKYGLSVTGTVHPERVLTNTGAEIGDRLILTKPLGTGIINTAVKAEMANDELVARAIACMTALNKTAAELMREFHVHACTDVTGFGLLGHASEMIAGEEVGMTIDSASVPFFTGVQDLIETGMVPAGAYRNKEFRSHMVEASPGLPYWRLDLLFDPQTSGGLLIALSPHEAEILMDRLRKAGIEEAAIIGEVVAEPAGKIVVR